jgi:hypothetical protein
MDADEGKVNQRRDNEIHFTISQTWGASEWFSHKVTICVHLRDPRAYMTASPKITFTKFPNQQTNHAV